MDDWIEYLQRESIMEAELDFLFARDPVFIEVHEYFVRCTQDRATREGRLETAQALKQAGVPLATIGGATGISEGEIADL